MTGLLPGYDRRRLDRYGTLHVDQAGFTLRDALVERVVVRAPGFRAINVMAVGREKESTNVGLFDFRHERASGRLEHCLVAPDYPSLWLTGVIGHDFSASGVEVHTVTDGFGVYNTHSRGPVNVTIEDSWVHDLTYFTDDPNHGDRHTHNDCVQVQGGTRVRVARSRLEAFASREQGDYTADPYRPAVTGSAIAVTPNVAPVGWLHVEECFLDGGAQSVTLIPGKFGRVKEVGSVVNNTFGRGQAPVKKGLRRARRPGVAHPHVGVTWRGNAYEDGSPARLTVTRRV